MARSKEGAVSHAERVEIEWRDAAHWREPWIFAEEWVDQAASDGLPTILTIGYIVAKTKDYVLVARDLQMNDDNSVSRVGGPFGIPAGCIVAIRKVAQVAGSPLRTKGRRR